MYTHVLNFMQTHPLQVFSLAFANVSTYNNCSHSHKQFAHVVNIFVSVHVSCKTYMYTVYTLRLHRYWGWLVMYRLIGLLLLVSVSDVLLLIRLIMNFTCANQSLHTFINLLLCVLFCCLFVHHFCECLGNVKEEIAYLGLL